ncbi:MAG TPA: HEAT repeat domain-containing protein [Candidatus Acidoferrales bacterium]|nr:HEAT repeat domain-containing protein [Candidatus Acidoferrales bacterium]
MTNEDMTNQACGEWRPLLILLAAGGELDPAGQARLAAHLADCASCSATLQRESELLALLGSHRDEPGADLLAACRASLEDALDREEERGWLRRTFGSLIPSNWLAPRPAWSATVLLLIGFSVGVFGPRLLRRPANADASDGAAASKSATAIAPSSPADSGSAAGSALTSLDLHSADVAGISVFPSGDEGPARVQLQLKAQRPVTVEGTVNDDDVKGALLGVLKSGERSCPDVRLDAVECLRGRSNDPDVRSVLCQVVHSDPNAAVRLKALEALDGAEPQEMVRQTLLDALVDDQNPGVRIEAVNALRDMAAKGQAASDDRMFSVLHDRMQKDPNTYIRLQSAAAIRDLGPREKF